MLCHVCSLAATACGGCLCVVVWRRQQQHAAAAPALGCRVQGPPAGAASACRFWLAPAASAASTHLAGLLGLQADLVNGVDNPLLAD